MKYLFLLLLLGITLTSCKNNEPTTDSGDYGLLILQKRMDSMEKRLNSLDSNLRQTKGEGRIH